jgi:hypothetical protein
VENQTNWKMAIKRIMLETKEIGIAYLRNDSAIESDITGMRPIEKVINNWNVTML